MYHLKPLSEFHNPLPPSGNMYYMKPLVQFQNNPASSGEQKSISVDALTELQDKVLLKLRDLSAEIDTISNGNGRNAIEMPLDIAKMTDVQDDILKRLRTVLSRFETISRNANVTFTAQPLEKVSNVTSAESGDVIGKVTELDIRQNSINRRLNDLRKALNELATQNNITLSGVGLNPVHNVTLFWTSRPPVSVILLLALLQKRGGVRVGCKCYRKGCRLSGDERMGARAELVERFVRAVGLDMVDSRETYDVIVSIVYRSKERTATDIDDLVCYDNVIDSVPMIGEMVVLAHLCSSSVFGIDFGGDTTWWNHVESVNDDLMYGRNVKGALSLINNKLASDINISSAKGDVVSVFVVSCLINRNQWDKVNKTVKTSLENVLKECSVTNVIDLMSLVE